MFSKNSINILKLMQNPQANINDLKNFYYEMIEK